MSSPEKYGYKEEIIDGVMIATWVEYGNREEIIREMNTPEHAKAVMELTRYKSDGTERVPKFLSKKQRRIKNQKLRNKKFT